MPGARLVIVAGMSAGYQGTYRPVASIAEAVTRMERVQEAVPASDGLACFNRMYLDVTRAADRRPGRGAAFQVTAQ
jgi:hypothetical protein